jgi:hypothetical protein
VNRAPAQSYTLKFPELATEEEEKLLIGVASIWPKLFFLLVFIGFLSVFINGWSKVAKRKAPVTGKLLFGSIFFLLWAFLFIQLAVREMAFHQDLAGLRQEAVKSIEVADQTLDDPDGISKVVTSLNRAQWFEVNHGGWADEVPLAIHFGSGQQRTYHVALYLRQEGAVLISMSNFGRAGKGSGWSNGVAFCPQLPSALAASRVYLPRARTERQKGQNAQSENSTSERWSRRVVPTAIFGFFTLSALAVFRRQISGQGPGSHTLRNSNSQLGFVTTIGGLAVVSVIAAGCGLRVMYALFDWPDPTNARTILSVWLGLLSGGIILLMLRQRKR